MKTDTLQPELVLKITPILEAGEDLLWVGRPTAYRMIFHPITRANVRQGVKINIGSLLVLLFGGLAAFVMVVLSTVNSLLLGVAAVIALITVIGALSVPHIYLASHTLYVVTDQRAIIMQAEWVQSYGEQDMTRIERKMRGRNRGDLIFRYDPVTIPVRTILGPLFRDVEIPLGFFGIDNVRAVETIMLQTFGFDEDDTLDSGADDTYEDEAARIQDMQ